MARKYVVDTNVAIVANGNNADVSSECRLAAVESLLKAVQTGRIHLDSGGQMQAEYARYLSPRGAPGVGDQFYLLILNSHPDRIVRVDVEKRGDGEYVDLPQAVIDVGFDRSDRVFAAVAKKSRATVLNAVDSDWLDKREVLERSGIKVEFICGCDTSKWFV